MRFITYGDIEHKMYNYIILSLYYYYYTASITVNKAGNWVCKVPDGGVQSYGGYKLQRLTTVERR